MRLYAQDAKVKVTNPILIYGIGLSFALLSFLFFALRVSGHSNFCLRQTRLQQGSLIKKNLRIADVCKSALAPKTKSRP